MSAATASTLDDAVEWVDEITLEETPEVINVSPNVTVDTAGRFIIADPREAQVRIYGPSGRLAHHFGAEGHGPLEFQNPTKALRMPSGNLLVTDFSGKVAIFDSAGSSLLHSGRAPVHPLFDAQALNDTLVLLAGRVSGQGPKPLLHVWNVSSGKLLRSFFTPPVKRGFEDETLITGAVSTAIRGDTVAALFSASDTVYLFGLDGSSRGKIPIPARHFRPLNTALPAGSSREGLMRWLESFSLMHSVFWRNDGSLLVQYADKVAGEQKLRLVHMTREGHPIFEVRDTPRLLATDGAGSTLYFVKPGSPTPNVWSVATWAR